MILSILIPTTIDRRKEFELIYNKLKDQSLWLPAEVLYLEDNKELSIGKKRDQLYKMAKGKYSVQIDSDDDVSDDYVKSVLTVINKDHPDCIGYCEHLTMNGVNQRSSISIQHKEWSENKPPINGFDYFRTPFFKTPILTSLCVSTGVKYMRFGEDHDFAKRIFPFLNTQSFIEKDMYYYTGSSLTVQQHKERYGISK